MIGGGVLVLEKLQIIQRGANVGTASIIDSIGGLSVSPTKTEIESSPTEFVPEISQEKIDAQSIIDEPVQNTPVVFEKLAENNQGSIYKLIPEYISFSSPIGPMGGGGGGSNPVNISNAQASAVESATLNSTSTTSQEATSTTIVATSTESTSNTSTTIAIEVTATSTTSTIAVPAVVYYPLALCVLEPTASSSQNQAEAIPAVNYLLISRILVDNEGADTNEFVEIFNPTDVPVSLTSWSLQYLSGGATYFSSITKKNFVYDTAVAGRASFLVGMGDFASSSDMRWTQSLNNTGATIFLVHGQTMIGGVSDVRIVDRVAYGTGVGLHSENQPAVLPSVDQTITRKSLVGGVCVEPENPPGDVGNGCDTNNNFADFVTQPFIVLSPPVLSAQ